MSEKLKISIITVSFNSAKTIRDTIESVLNQGYPSVEYIIKDGGSTDETLKIVSEYSDKVTLISSKDQGIYDAINQGIKVATGDIIGLLHSDDLLADSEVLTRIADAFEGNACDAVYGDLHYVMRDNPAKIFREWKAGEYRDGIFVQGWMPPHPTFYVRRSVFEKFGDYRTDFKISADYELMLRFIHKHKIRLTYLPKVLVSMRVGGVSNRSVRHRLLANKEDVLAWKVNGIKPGIFTRFLKPLSKLQQFLRR